MSIYRPHIGDREFLREVDLRLAVPLASSEMRQFEEGTFYAGTPTSGDRERRHAHMIPNATNDIYRKTSNGSKESILPDHEPSGNLIWCLNEMSGDGAYYAEVTFGSAYL